MRNFLFIYSLASLCCIALVHSAHLQPDLDLGEIPNEEVVPSQVHFDDDSEAEITGIVYSDDESADGNGAQSPEQHAPLEHPRRTPCKQTFVNLRYDI